MTIRIRDLEKRYIGASSPILRQISLDVPAGKTAALLGSSGSGKSTLLRCLVGLEGFQSGRLEVDDVVVMGTNGSDPVDALAAARATLRGRIGLVFQSFELFPHLTVLENCSLAPVVVKSASRAESETRAVQLLEQFGLADKAGSFPEQLSGGQRQRVAIARALAMEPQTLLYDEPTSALDPSLRHEVRDALCQVRDSGVSQIVATHDVELARDIADVVFLIDRGTIAASGQPGDVLDDLGNAAVCRLLGVPGGTHGSPAA